MSTTIYGIKACDTMKKARAWLDDHGVGPANEETNRLRLATLDGRWVA